MCMGLFSVCVCLSKRANAHAASIPMFHMFHADTQRYVDVDALNSTIQCWHALFHSGDDSNIWTVVVFFSVCCFALLISFGNKHTPYVPPVQTK